MEHGMGVTRLVVLKYLRSEYLKRWDKGGSQFWVKRGPKKEPFWGEKFSPVLVTLVVGEDSRPQLDWRSPPLPPTTTHTHSSVSSPKTETLWVNPTDVDREQDF